MFKQAHAYQSDAGDACYEEAVVLCEFNAVFFPQERIPP
jgi:hypothetical protein